MKNKGKNLIINTIILMFGKFSTQFVSFLLLPLYTSYLSSKDYGIVDLIITYISLFVPVITIQVEMYLFRFLIDSRKKEEEKKSIITNSYFIALIMSLFFICTFCLINSFLHIKYFVFIIIMLIVTIWSNLNLQSTRGLGDNLGYSLSCIISCTINVILNLIFMLKLNLDIYSIFLSNIISNSIGSLFLFIRNRLYDYLSIKSINKNMQYNIIKYTLPLVPNGVVWWVIDASDRTIISLILGMSFNGIYSISNKFSNIINSVYSIFNMSWTESVSMYINDKDDFLNNTFNNIFKIICSFCLLLISVMFIIFPILINIKYEEAYKYIFFLIISSIFNMLSSNLSAIYIALKKTKKILYTTIISAVINILLNILLIRNIGLYAAVISTLISFFILFILRYIDVKKYVSIKLDKSNIILFSVMFMLSAIIYYSNNIILKSLGFVLVLIFVVLLNKDFILKNINLIKK